MSLLIAPAGPKAARHAVMRWHYSQSIPVGRSVTFGVWEDDRFTGVVIFSRGASNHLGLPYGLAQTEICELTRIAFRDHQVPVSQIVAQSIRRLKAGSPGLRLVVSFADPREGHHGGIYQAGNWIYTGITKPERVYQVNGKLLHARSLGAVQMGKRTGLGGRSIAWIRANLDPVAKVVTVPGKHRYLYPLDRAMRRKVTPLARPYPAAEVSTATRPATGGERQVQALQAAL